MFECLITRKWSYLVWIRRCCHVGIGVALLGEMCVCVCEKCLDKGTAFSSASEKKAGIMRERTLQNVFFLLFSLGETHGNTSMRHTGTYLCESHLHEITAQICRNSEWAKQILFF